MGSSMDVYIHDTYFTVIRWPHVVAMGVMLGLGATLVAAWLVRKRDR
jgi:hypothetical protein